MTENNQKSKWGVGVSILYSIFVLFILTLVMYVSLQDIQLVEKNYYEKDLTYQDQYERIDRTNQLEKKLTITMSDESGNIFVNFPVEINKQISGNIKFFRPSNAGLDFEVPIKTDSLGVQQIDTKSMTRGFWKVQINWTVDTVEYYQQEPLMIN